MRFQKCFLNLRLLNRSFPSYKSPFSDFFRPNSILPFDTFKFFTLSLLINIFFTPKLTPKFNHKNPSKLKFYVSKNYIIEYKSIIRILKIWNDWKKPVSGAHFRFWVRFRNKFWQPPNQFSGLDWCKFQNFWKMFKNDT